MNRFFKLVAAALLVPVMGAGAAFAQSLTVFDGNQVSPYVPFPTADYNVYNTRGQVIYPAESLSPMVGQTINGFTLYINDEGCKMNGGALAVSVGEVAVASFSTTSYFTGLTQMATVQMTAGSHIVDVDFLYPYVYSGQNLVIDFTVQGAGESAPYNFTYFYGLFQPTHTALSGGEYREFLPKTTFYYGDKEQYAVRTNPRDVTFDVIRAGQTAQATVSLKNIGTAAITPAVAASAPFTASIAAGQLLYPGQSRDIVLTFAPEAAGDYQGMLTISYGEDGTLEVPVCGSALESGEEIVLCGNDSTATTNKLPFNGVYFSDAGTYGQMIYPAQMLTDVQGCKLISMSFYPQNPINLKDGTVQISLKATDQAEFTTTAAITGMTAVSSMALTRGVDVITFEFDTPFEYDGGNLAVEARIMDSKGNYGTTLFHGEAMNYYAGLSVTNSPWSGESAERIAFLPKVSFIYQQSAHPQVMMGDVNGDRIVDVQDVTTLIAAVLSGDFTTIVTEAANMNSDSVIDVEDVTLLINRVLMGQ